MFNREKKGNTGKKTVQIVVKDKVCVCVYILLSYGDK